MAKNKDVQVFAQIADRSFTSKEEADNWAMNTSVNSTHWLSVPTEVISKVSCEASILYGNLLGYTGNRASNTLFADKMHTSTRTITRLINELKSAGCIKVVYLNKSNRLIYPVYQLPVLYNADQRKPKEKVGLVEAKLPSDGFEGFNPL